MRTVTTALITAFILLTAAALHATAVRFEGEAPPDADKLERQIRHLSPTTVKTSSLADSATQCLQSEGFLDARVTAIGDTLSILTGPLYSLKAMIVTDSADISRPVDGVFSRANVDRLLNGLLAEYQSRGFYYTKLSVTGMSRQNTKIILHVAVSRGPAVTVAASSYQGITRTRPDLLSRYLPVHSGDRLTDSTLDLADRAAAAIPFLDFAPPVTVKPRSGYTQADLEYNFFERKQIAILGGAGYLPDNSGGMIWNLDLKLRNLFGDGREGAVKSERLDRGHNLLSISYGQPAFLLGLGWFRADVLTRDYRDQFYEFGLSAGYTTRISQRLNLGATLGWKRVDPAYNLNSYRLFSAGFDLSRDALDNRFNPSRGLNLKAALSYDYRRYVVDSLSNASGATFNETRSHLSIAWFTRLIGPIIGSLDLNYAGLETGEPAPPVSELVLMGGPGTLRGFRNEQFAVQRTAYGSLEPRLRFNSGYLFAFYDAAYLNAPLSDSATSVRTSELYRYGFGGGLALTSGVRSVKLSLAWNPDLAFDQPWLAIEFSSDL